MYVIMRGYPQGCVGESRDQLAHYHMRFSHVIRRSPMTTLLFLIDCSGLSDVAGPNESYVDMESTFMHSYLGFL
jgi:hypothetical protein